MTPDFSRISFNPQKDYTGVLLQQGRALVDAEWNEQCAVINEQMRRSLAEILERLPGQFSPEYDEIRLDGLDYKVKLHPGAFFVEGVRCDPQSLVLPRDQDGFVSVRNMGFNNPSTERCTLSVHAWEQIVSSRADLFDLPEKNVNTQASIDRSLSDPALANSDSGLRTQIVWTLQADDALDPGRDYQHWIKEQRGRIKVKLAPRQDNRSPCLYRVQIKEDVAEISQDKIKLWQDTAAIDTPGGKTTDREFIINLDGRLEIVFERKKPYRRDDFWLIPYRGEKTLQFLYEDKQTDKDDRWLAPTGQHYYARVQRRAVQRLFPPPPYILTSSSAQEPSSQTDLQIDGSAVSDSLDHSGAHHLMPASFIGKVQCLPLKRWLSTALLAEILTKDFDAFWYRLVTQLPQVAIGDAGLRAEAQQLWNTARRVMRSLETKHDHSPGWPA